MFIDIWDKDNKAIKINKFSKALNSNYNKTSNIAVCKLVADYGIVLEGNRIKTDYYEIYFEFKQDNCRWFNNELNFLTLFDCFTFLISDVFKYLYESKDIDFIEITANKRVMFEYDNRE
jgi:hypothetical protein